MNALLVSPPYTIISFIRLQSAYKRSLSQTAQDEDLPLFHLSRLSLDVECHANFMFVISTECLI